MEYRTPTRLSRRRAHHPAEEVKEEFIRRARAACAKSRARVDPRMRAIAALMVRRSNDGEILRHLGRELMRHDCRRFGFFHDHDG